MGTIQSKLNEINDAPSLISDITKTQKVLSTISRNLKKIEKRNLENLGDVKWSRNTIGQIETKIDDLSEGELKRKVKTWVETERLTLESFEKKITLVKEGYKK